MTNEEQGDLNSKNLAAQACEIEINTLNKPIGRQDQYISALGGLSCLKFMKGGSVKMIPLSNIKRKTINQIIDNLFLIPSLKTRSADKVLQNLKDDKSSISQIKEIKEIALSFINYNDERSFKIEEEFHKSVKDSWEIKRQMTNVMDLMLEEQYKEISNTIPNNWIRLLGAGSGGYFLISPKMGPVETSKILEDSKFCNFIKADISSTGVVAKRF